MHIMPDDVEGYEGKCNRVRGGAGIRVEWHGAEDALGSGQRRRSRT